MNRAQSNQYRFSVARLELDVALGSDGGTRPAPQTLLRLKNR
jgi:hypothetical protein